MNLDEYLKKIEKCPNEELDKFGIFGSYFDTYSISLKGNLIEVIRDIEDSDKFKFKEMDILGGGYGFGNWYEYTPCSVLLHLYDKAINLKLLGKKQKEKYNLLMDLHRNPKPEKIQNIPTARAFAITIKFLLNYIKEKNIPACFPVSTISVYNRKKKVIKKVVFGN